MSLFDTILSGGCKTFFSTQLGGGGAEGSDSAGDNQGAKKGADGKRARPEGASKAWVIEGLNGVLTGMAQETKSCTRLNIAAGAKNRTAN